MYMTLEPDGTYTFSDRLKIYMSVPISSTVT